MAKKQPNQTRLKIAIENLKAQIQAQPAEIQSQLNFYLAQVENEAREVIEAVRRAVVCYIYGTKDSERQDYFKSLFYSQTKKIYINDIS